MQNIADRRAKVGFGSGGDAAVLGVGRCDVGVCNRIRPLEQSMLTTCTWVCIVGFV